MSPSPAGRLFGWALLLALAGACSQGPQGPKAPSVTALDYETHTPFPIATGAHAHADCNSCHGSFDTFRQFSCLECHQHSRDVTDPRHVRVPDYAWESTRCYACHPSGTAAGVDHTAFFPIGPSTIHAGISCATCHVDPANRKVVDCITCHTAPKTDPVHTGIPGYEWTSPKCLSCHPQSTIPGIDHTGFFPIGAGTTHAGIACSTCHVDRTNRKAVDCIGCHTAPKTNPIHTGIPGYEWTNPQCLSCHPKGDIPGMDHSAYFPIQAGATHAGISCSTCHVDRTNRKVVDCVTCHTPSTTDPRHGQVGGYARDSALCLRCHGDSQVKRVSTHLPFAILSGYKHYRTSCLVCHPVARTDKPFAQDFNPFDCLSCHSKGAMDDKHQSFSTYRYVSTTCVTSGCHANGRKP